MAPARTGGQRVIRYGRRARGCLAEEPRRGPDMKIVVDYDLCESNAVCMGIAPEVFEVRDDDFLYILDENPDESLREKVEESARRCPKQAITIVD
jgi:ferredoxin